MQAVNINTETYTGLRHLGLRSFFFEFTSTPFRQTQFASQLSRCRQTQHEKLTQTQLNFVLWLLPWCPTLKLYKFELNAKIVNVPFSTKDLRFVSTDSLKYISIFNFGKKKCFICGILESKKCSFLVFWGFLQTVAHSTKTEKKFEKKYCNMLLMILFFNC